MLILGGRHDPIPNGFERIDCTSHTDNAFWAQLSPFILGPVELYAGLTSHCVENAWQFSKVYPDQIDDHGEPTPEWFRWRDEGFHSHFASRYPKGRGVRPAYSYWEENGVVQHLDLISARKKIYLPLYYQAVIKTEAFQLLKRKYDQGEDIFLADFDGYDYKQRNMSLLQVIENEKKTMGHCVALAVALGEPLGHHETVEMEQVSLF